MSFFKKNDGNVSLSTIQLHASTVATQPGLLSVEDLKHLSGVVVGKPIFCRIHGDNNVSGFLSVLVTSSFKNWNPLLHLSADQLRTEVEIHVSFYKDHFDKLNGWVSYGIHYDPTHDEYHLAQLVGL